LRITITGAAGRLGEVVIRELEADHELLLFDRKLPEDEPRFRDHPHLQGDLLSYEDCLSAITDADAVVHLAAIPSATDQPRYAEMMAARGGPVLPFDETMRVNTMGTWYLLSAARQANVGSVIMASSNAVFGWEYLRGNPSAVEYLPLDENHPIYPVNSYALSKRLDEQIMAAFTRSCGMRTYGLRPGWIHSPMQLQELAGNIAPSDGWQGNFYNYVDIRDMARAFRLCLEAAEGMELHHDVFCVTAADTRALEDSKELIERFYPELAEKAAGLIGRQSFISPEKARRLFGYEPQHSWTEFRA